jgi:hypothetical protein
MASPELATHVATLTKNIEDLQEQLVGLGKPPDSSQEERDVWLGTFNSLQDVIQRHQAELACAKAATDLMPPLERVLPVAPPEKRPRVVHSLEDEETKEEAPSAKRVRLEAAREEEKARLRARLVEVEAQKKQAFDGMVRAENERAVAFGSLKQAEDGLALAKDNLARAEDIREAALHRLVGVENEKAALLMFLGELPDCDSDSSDSDDDQPLI